MKRIVLVLLGGIIGAVVGFFAVWVFITLLVVLSMNSPRYDLLHPFLDTPIVQTEIIVFTLVGCALGAWIGYRVSKPK